MILSCNHNNILKPAGHRGQQHLAQKGQDKKKTNPKPKATLVAIAFGFVPLFSVCLGLFGPGVVAHGPVMLCGTFVFKFPKNGPATNGNRSWPKKPKTNRNQTPTDTAITFAIVLKFAPPFKIVLAVLNRVLLPMGVVAHGGRAGMSQIGKFT